MSPEHNLRCRSQSEAEEGFGNVTTVMWDSPMLEIIKRRRNFIVPPQGNLCVTAASKERERDLAQGQNIRRCRNSDHNLVFLHPTYTPVVKKTPPTKKVIRLWSDDCSEALRDCFECTDWQELCRPPGEDIDALTHCITDYINFCMENTVPIQVRCLSKNKPRVTPKAQGLSQGGPLDSVAAVGDIHHRQPPSPHAWGCGCAEQLL